MALKFNPFTGRLDLVGTSSGAAGAENFSYKTVIIGNTVTIPLNQQMLVHHEFILEGTLIADGDLTIIEG